MARRKLAIPQEALGRGPEGTRAVFADVQPGPEAATPVADRGIRQVQFRV